MGRAVPTDAHACWPLRMMGGPQSLSLQSGWGTPARECELEPVHCQEGILQTYL